MPYGFAKNEDESNDEYLDSIKGDPWYPVILGTHEQLLAIDPDYRIAQIKEKFWGLRYYFDSTYDFSSQQGKKMHAIVSAAEKQIDDYEASKKKGSN